jgi:hydrophobic/amphiphilic exporter-1 (mainly G- bacteria), HAE1 family
MQWLARICVERPVFATVLVLFITVIGVVAYSRLSVDRFPKVDLPTITVTTRLSGASPEDVETEITDKIEEAVNTISSIDELRSISSEGISQVFITFLLEKDVDIAAQEVRDKVANIIPDLPKDIDQPIVGKTDPDAAPVLLVALNANRPLREITELADKKVRRAIENVSGVGQVTIIGGRKRQVNVWLDPLKLRSFGLSASDVQKAIGNQNLTLPGGDIDTGPQRLTVRVRGRVTSAEDLGNVVIREQAQSPIRVRDVARVEDGEVEAETAALRDGVPTVLLSVRRQSGENSVDTVDAVRAKMKELLPQLPGGYTLEVVRDNTETTRTSVEAVKEHLILGAIFAALIVLLFLGSVRSTVIAALAIPTSIIGTFALMYAKGFTLNSITLLALALAVGIVIDDAIVILENIVSFIEKRGEQPRAAAINATKDIGLAVLATTLSLLAVFMPVAFLGGIPGRFLSSFGVTMACAIAVSLLVSFTLTPMLASRWLKAKSLDGDHRSLLERGVEVFYHPVERAYEASLRWVMRRRWVVVLAMIGALASIPTLFKMIPKGFLPKSDEAQLQIGLRVPEGSSLQATALAAERIAREVRTLGDVTHTVVTIGDNDQRTPNLASIFVRLTDPDRRDLSQDDLEDKIRKEIIVKQPKEYRIDVSDVPAFEGGGNSNAQVNYTITGPDLQGLTQISTRALESLKKIHGVVDADTTLILGKPEVALDIDRDRAGDLGVQVQDIAGAMQLLVGGLRVSNYEELGNQYDVRMRADPKYRSNIDALGLLTVPSSHGPPIPLLDVVRTTTSTGPSQINRLNRQRQVTLTSNTAPGVGAGEVVAAFDQALKDMHLPAGYEAKPSGLSREIGRTFQNFMIAFGLSFVFMFLILAAQFESWVHPITILLALPLVIPFAFASLAIFHQGLDIFSMLGLLVLFGVVKKNGILQVDHTNTLRAHGMARDEAIVIGSRDRLRPILMTTLAFVAGMVPLLASKGIGAGFNQDTAGVVVGGQSLSLVLTLFATPVMYSFLDDLQRWFRRVVLRGNEEPEVAKLASISDPQRAAG